MMGRRMGCNETHGEFRKLMTQSKSSLKLQCGDTEHESEYAVNSNSLPSKCCCALLLSTLILWLRASPKLDWLFSRTTALYHSPIFLILRIQVQSQLLLSRGTIKTTSKTVVKVEFCYRFSSDIREKASNMGRTVIRNCMILLCWIENCSQAQPLARFANHSIHQEFGTAWCGMTWIHQWKIAIPKLLIFHFRDLFPYADGLSIRRSGPCFSQGHHRISPLSDTLYGPCGRLPQIYHLPYISIEVRLSDELSGQGWWSAIFG